MMKVFVSHSSADRAFAVKLRRGIENLGLSVFDPASDLPSGGSWEDKLRKALEDCDAMVYVPPAPGKPGANMAFFEAGAARARAVAGFGHADVQTHTALDGHDDVVDG